MKIRVIGSAKNDLLEGYAFYESQEQGVGRYFLDSLYADIESLVLYAGIHEKQFQKYHRMLAKRFPYAVYYRIEAMTIVIYAILDCRRDPDWIEKRLD
jgi:hypothetical protein